MCIEWLVMFGEYVNQFAHLVAGLGLVAEGLLAIHRVDVAATTALFADVASVFEICDDRLGGAFCHPGCRS